MDSYERFNETVADIPVTPGYDILVTQGNVTYRYLSTNGRLTISPVWASELAEALASCGTRVHLPDNLDEKKLFDRIAIEGDGAQLRAMQRELQPHNAMIESAMEPYREPDTEARLALKEEEEWRDEERRRLVPHSGVDRSLLEHFRSGPWTETMQRVVVFSAFSTMNGNIGQSNYVASNIALEFLAHRNRQQAMSAEWVAVMWAAVGHIGMRWKAFGSNDMLQQMDDGKVLFTIQDSQKILWVTCVADEPIELASASLFDSYTMGVAKQTPAAQGHGPANVPGLPWASTSPKNVKLTTNAATRRQPPPESITAQGVPTTAEHPASEAARDVCAESQFAVGLKVRLVGLTSHPKMNGLTGVIMSKTRTGKWRVSFNAMEDKLLDAKFLEPASSLNVAAPRKPLPEILEAKQRHLYCIAGSWDEWTPHDMTWDGTHECYHFEVRLRKATFQLCRGKAGASRWSSKGKTWSIGSDHVESSYDIRLFVRDTGVIKKVDWITLER